MLHIHMDQFRIGYMLVVPDQGVIHVIHYWNDTVGPYRPNPRKRL
jgi:hypothetical protein